MSHIVQIGTDDSVFALGRDAEFVQRQVLYGKLLADSQPGSIMTLIILTPNKAARLLQIDNVTFKPLVVNLQGFSKIAAWFQLYSCLKQLDRVQRIDVLTTQTVHDEAWVALWFALRGNRAIVGQIHYDIFNPRAQATVAHNWVGRVRYTLALHWLKHFTAVRVVGRSVAREILTKHLHTKVAIVPVTMAMLADEIPIRDSVPKVAKVLYVGRLASEKNLTAWIAIAERVIRAMPQASFEIVGGGVLKSELEGIVTRKGLSDKIKLLGAVDYSKLPAIYQSASVFLLTSLYEGFGRVVAEALANGVPVVAPKIGGVEDIVVQDQSGYLLPPADIDGMAECVIKLLRDPVLAAKMGDWGREYVCRNFEPRTLANNWVQLLIEQVRS